MNRRFLIVLTAEAISSLGSQVTMVALPLTAVLILHADPLDMGLLSGISALPAVIFGLFAGVLIDRWPKRRVLIIANAISAVVMLLVPLGHALVFLSIPLLMLVRFIASTISVGEGIGLNSTIPALVPPDALADANGRFGAVMSVTALIGPAIAGLLIAAFSAPGAITADAASFAVAVGLIALLPHIPVPTVDHAAEGSVRDRLRAGFAFMRADPVMRPLMFVAIALNFFGSIFGALEALFIVGHLGVKPAWFGGALAASGIGAIAGALISAPVARRFDVMATLTGAIVLFVISLGGISALHGAPMLVAIGFGACNLIGGFGGAIVNVAISTHIQTATPEAMLARVMGVLISTFSATTPLGALLGGLIAAGLGLRITLIGATLGFFAVFVWLAFTARRRAAQPPIADHG
ncbi:MFS transporter [Acidiphilium sp. PA]|uniref:MFS transporter n=1 Tax=Acidiphilium sp. PA TaxID=2871705 RepID=UPI002242F68D|nr:MFS transporter [Acidiphilium sp. PA]MCW8307600.1 MFS transporter [Acidiphilium sp. PA]